MDNSLIFRYDLTHTSQGYATELAPYPVACFMHFNQCAGRNRVEDFKSPQRFHDLAILLRSPRVHSVHLLRETERNRANRNHPPELEQR